MEARFPALTKILPMLLLVLVAVALSVAEAVRRGKPRERPRRLGHIQFTQLDWHTPDGNVLPNTWNWPGAPRSSLTS
jgi:hypothetical protein